MVSAVREHLRSSLVASPGAAVLAPVVVQLVLPITVVLIGDAAGAERMLRQRRYRQPACHARAQQLEINLQAPARHSPSAQGKWPQRCRPRRQRPVRPHAAADALALEHMDLAEKIAGNFARRTIHLKEDLMQLAMIGLIKAARRYDPSRGPRSGPTGAPTPTGRSRTFCETTASCSRSRQHGGRFMRGGSDCLLQELIQKRCWSEWGPAVSGGYRSSMHAHCG